MIDFRYYVFSAIALVVWFAAAWVTVDLFHLTGALEILVRLLLLGLGSVVICWVMYRKHRTSAGSGVAVPQELADLMQEIDLLVRDAETKLAVAKTAQGAKLGRLPLVLVIGEQGSAKTNVLLHGGLEAELLAGQTYQESSVVSTRSVNIWLSKGVLFVEAGGALLDNPRLWAHFVKKLQAPTVKLPFTKSPAPPRAAVVCSSIERFLEDGAQDKLGVSARKVQGRLGEASQILGCSFPVYVLFTKLDRVTGFSEFVGNLADVEVLQVLGATLPGEGTIKGVYAEEQAKTVSHAFARLRARLSEKRLPLLERENDGAKLSPIYEFPRELKKLERLLVQYAVDLGRPSQLRANPFLRGFYFSGVRPVVVREAAPAQVRTAQSNSVLSGALDAEAILRAQGNESPLLRPAAPPAQERMRRVPQWVFLSHLFEKVILGDRAAQSASSSSAQADTLQRIALSAAGLLGLVWLVGGTISFFGNRSLETTSLEAARGAGVFQQGTVAQELPSLDSLQKLDAVRQSAELLSRYQREGAPLKLRFGLYVGNDIRPAVRSLYFRRFHQMLFGSTQVAIILALRGLPSAPGPMDEYAPTYDTLKAYLITTSNPDKSTRAFLSPYLLNRWAANRSVDTVRRGLAQLQFDFYSDELRTGNPYSSDNEAPTIERARAYLAQFNAIERIYQFMVAEVSRQNPPINFNRQFPGSVGYVSSSREIAGAFSLKGWSAMQQALKNLPQYFGGERWVLGDRSYEKVDLASLGPALWARYQADYIGQWREYLKASHVVPYGSVADAAQKLNQLSGNQSYLLGLFCVASVNTSIAADEVRAPYQPLHSVEPVPCEDKYVQQVNSGYITALAGLQSAMDRLSKTSDQPNDLVSATLNEASNAYRVTRQIAQGFRIDRDGNVHGLVQSLMEEPIRNAELLIGRLGPAQINAEGRKFCVEYGGLTKKYPFNTTSTSDASLDEVDSIFRPIDGKLAVLYEVSLKNYLDRQAGQFVRKPDARVKITDNFLRFFNRAMSFSTALYRGESRSAKLTYAMKALPADGLRGITLNLDGQELASTGAGGDWKEFSWPGAATRSARLAGNLGGGDLSFIQYDGLWAAFRFFGDADRFEASQSNYTLQWVPRQGQSAQPIRLDGGKVLTLPFMLDLKGAPPVFQKGYLVGMECVADVAR